MIAKESSKRIRGGGISVAVVYPGSRAEGMSSLAVHTLIRLVRDHGGICERVFLPARSGDRPRSEESRSPLTDFDLLAFSVTFEEQWVLVPFLLARSGIPPRFRDRSANHPVVLVGGMASRLNPGPALPFVDLIAPGEAECLLPAILQGLAAGAGVAREDLIESLGHIRGVYTRWSEGRHCTVAACLDPGPQPAAQVQTDPDSVFRNMFLVETARGCPGGCRFCAVGFSRRPPLFFSAAQIREAARPGVDASQKIGLVGPSLALHPELPQLLEALSGAGADLSPASLHSSSLSGAAGQVLLSHLKRSGQRSITLAPETGSERLSRTINKPLRREELELAVHSLAEAGVLHLKLYLMYGLPTEEDTDLEATGNLVRDVHRWFVSAHRSSGRIGRLSVSLNPFVPKPHTPFAGEPMPAVSELGRRWKKLRAVIGKAGGVQISGFSPRLAALQCLLDRSGAEIAPLLEHCQGRWPPSASLLGELCPQHGELVHLAWPQNREPPGNMVDTGLGSYLLAKERELALAAATTPACDPERCGSCQACPGLV